MLWMAVNMNIVVIAPDYRKGPENKMPAGITDVETCFDFMHANADKYGFNADRMTLGGESGGALVALGAAIRISEAGHSNKIRALFLHDPMVACLAS